MLTPGRPPGAHVRRQHMEGESMLTGQVHNPDEAVQVRNGHGQAQVAEEALQGGAIVTRARSRVEQVHQQLVGDLLLAQHPAEGAHLPGHRQHPLSYLLQLLLQPLPLLAQLSQQMGRGGDPGPRLFQELLQPGQILDRERLGPGAKPLQLTVPNPGLGQLLGEPICLLAQAVVSPVQAVQDLSLLLQVNLGLVPPGELLLVSPVCLLSLLLQRSRPRQLLAMLLSERPNMSQGQGQPVAARLLFMLQVTQVNLPPFVQLDKAPLALRQPPGLILPAPRERGRRADHPWCEWSSR